MGHTRTIAVLQSPLHLVDNKKKRLTVLATVRFSSSLKLNSKTTLYTHAVILSMYYIETRRTTTELKIHQHFIITGFDKITKLFCMPIFLCLH